jgi:hypothetical protein
MAFTIKKGDLIYATDGTLGFVADVYRPTEGDPDEGWAAVDVPGLGGPTYIQAEDVATRDETVPSALLKLTYEQATDEAHRREPEPIARGEARPEETPLLEVGRPELPGSAEDESLRGTPTSEPSRPPRPDAVRDWPPTGGSQPNPEIPR